MERIRVLVKPNKQVSQIVGRRNGILVVELAAPAINNRANVELVKLFKREGLSVVVDKGATSRIKTLKVL